jgi:vacuolar-type H+-ATPase subunit H
MEKHPDQSALTKTINEIKTIEEKREKIIAAAKEEAEKILRTAKENIAEERAKMEEELVAYKNEQLKKGRGDIEKEVDKILSDAKAKAEQLKKKKVEEKKLQKIALSLFE